LGGEYNPVPPKNIFRQLGIGGGGSGGSGGGRRGIADIMEKVKLVHDPDLLVVAHRILADTAATAAPAVKFRVSRVWGVGSMFRRLWSIVQDLSYRI